MNGKVLMTCSTKEENFQYGSGRAVLPVLMRSSASAPRKRPDHLDLFQHNPQLPAISALGALKVLCFAMTGLDAQVQLNAIESTILKRASQA
jgi:hypothetical protein